MVVKVTPHVRVLLLTWFTFYVVYVGFFDDLSHTAECMQADSFEPDTLILIHDTRELDVSDGDG
jgi:hypothetical protein